MAQYPSKLNSLIALLKKLPGVGTKSAERFAFHLLKWEEDELKELGEVIEDIKKNTPICPECRCFLSYDNHCQFCNNPKRNRKALCILSSPKDVYAFENTQSFHGIYHIIDRLLSPMQEIDEDPLHMDRLLEKIQKYQVEELIIALDSTLEGDATALYIKNQLEKFSIKISRLAFGLPIGSSLDFIDEGTLARALIGRQTF